MVGMTRIGLIEHTPKKDRPTLINKLHWNYIEVGTSQDHAQALTVCISYDTIDWKKYIEYDETEDELTLHFIDDANWPKLLSESDKHIVIDSLTTAGIT